MMWNRRCLLYVIVLVLAARETSSINEGNYRGGKSNFEKQNKGNEPVIPLLDRNSEVEKNKPRDESFVKDVEHEALIPDSTSRNGTGELATGTGSPLNNSDTSKAQNSHEQQSHSNKRHFHRSKIYRKEGKTKQRGNATKKTTNLLPSGTLLGIKSQEISRNLTSRKNRDSAKLMISESTARTTRPGSSIRTSDDFILLANSSLYIVANGSRERYSLNKTKFQDELSSKSSGFTSDDRSNSSSSHPVSVIEGKSSSEELTTFNFDPRSPSTLTQVAAETSSTKSATRDYDLTMNGLKSKKIFVDAVTNVIPTSVKSRGNYSIIRGISADNVSSAFPARRAKLKDESSFSPGSSDDSFDRISLARVIEALKNVGSPNPSEVEIGSAKRSRSLKDPKNINEPLISENPLPAYAEDIDQPLKLAVPLSFEVFIDNETVETLKDPLYPRRSLNATFPLPEKRKSDSEIVAQCSTKSFPRGDSVRQENAELGMVKKNVRNASSSVSIEGRQEGQSISSSTSDDGPIFLSEINEPVIRESFRESDDTTSDTEGVVNFFADIENCNASSLSPSFDGFSPETASKEFRETRNASTTEPESFYIIEGFRFFKNIGEDSPESEEDLERRETVSLDYGDTEVYPKIEDFFTAVKDVDRIEPETKEEPAVLLRKGNFGVRREDTSWWSNSEAEEKEAQKDVREIQKSADNGVQQRIEAASSYRIFFFNPGVYAIVGICLVVVIGGFSLWWSRTPLKRRRALPKMNRFVHHREETRNAVV